MMDFIPGFAQVKAALRFLPYAAIALLALFAAIQWQSARHWEKRYIGSEKAHSATKAAYTSAQVAAAELNAAKVALIERQYDAIAERTESEYAKNISDNRAALREWMRSKAAEGSASSATTGETAAVSGQSVQGATEAEFLVSQSDLETASDNYSQLVALRQWALDVGKAQTAPDTP